MNVASYNIKNIAVFDPGGTIEKAYETYRDIPMPKKCIKTIMENYPEWKVAEKIYCVKCNKSEKADKWFTKKLSKGRKNKEVALDMEGNLII
ncbi:hypothetical protein [Maribacter sp. 2307ULW6-5]|uniref:hypothetical protein n=1 Tax=Maribacter sp. 2307ULW6-5 TaxID=3386275 RepID=UPI0039BD8280